MNLCVQLDLYLFFGILVLLLVLVFTVIMPTNTKTPLKGGRKKVTASARARILTRKICKTVNTQDSYLEEPELQ